MGPAVQYTSENLAGPLTVFVYLGADGAFELYEDDGETNGYQRGAFSRIPFAYDEESGVLRIGARRGSYPGMAQERTINVRWISGPSAEAANVDAPAQASVRYNGSAIEVRRP
jgi:alpha-D-xyloside xylohydrolase